LVSGATRGSGTSARKASVRWKPPALAQRGPSWRARKAARSSRTSSGGTTATNIRLPMTATLAPLAHGRQSRGRARREGGPEGASARERGVLRVLRGARLALPHTEVAEEGAGDEIAADVVRGAHHPQQMIDAE